MNSSQAANRPSEIKAQYRGETRHGNGYSYWTTSPEDEESTDIRDQVASGDLDAKADAKPKRKPLFAAGAGKRTAIRLTILLLVGLVLGLIYFAINYFAVTGAADRDETQRVNAIVVLGAAQYNGSPSYVLQERLDHAYNLLEEGFADAIITTGAAAEGDSVTEGTVGQEHLLAKGVPNEKIILIPEGTNSWEQISAAAAVMQANQYDDILLVSDSYHTYRLLDIADELGITAYVSPSAVEPTMSDYLRETAAVSIGRITGYRRLSAFTE